MKHNQTKLFFIDTFLTLTINSDSYTKVKMSAGYHPKIILSEYLLYRMVKKRLLLMK